MLFFGLIRSFDEETIGDVAVQTPEAPVQAPETPEPVAPPVVVINDPVANRIDVAADLIERRGWIRGKETDGYGFCVRGALKHLTGGHIDVTAEAVISREAARMIPKRRRFSVIGTGNRIYYTSVDGVMVWNDTFARDSDEIISVMRAAAARRREELKAQHVNS